MRILVWLLRAFLFFTLFAFALNNSQEGVVRWFFGHEWRTPMVFVVLAAFGLGCAFGVFAMVPSWWRHYRVARRVQPADVLPEPAAPAPVMVGDLAPEHPPRDGL